MPIINHELTSTGIKVGSFVLLKDTYYTDRALRIPAQPKAFLLTKVISSDGAAERAEIYWSKEHDSGYLWVDPEDLQTKEDVE